MPIKKRQMAGVKTHALSSSDPDLVSEVMANLLPHVASADYMIKAMNMHRVAGNVYECPSTKDFWEVKEGKIFKLTKGNEVDNSEKLMAADSIDPEASLKMILDDLEFYN